LSLALLRQMTPVAVSLCLLGVAWRAVALLSPVVLVRLRAAGLSNSLRVLAARSRSVLLLALARAVLSMSPPARVAARLH
jgi:hypothetical protein